MAKYYFWICHCIFRCLYGHNDENDPQISSLSRNLRVHNDKLSPDPVQMAHYQFAGIVPEVHSASLAVAEPPAGGTLVFFHP